MKIARIATVPFFLCNHLRLQITDLVRAGHEIILISSGGPEVDGLKEIDGVRFVQLEIQRQISLLKDLISLWQMFFLFRKERFDIVHTTTPKAGMLGAIAAFLTSVPIRLHTFTGQAWAEMHGPKRQLAKLGDKLTVILNTRCYADSQSQRDFIVHEGVAPRHKIHVLGPGSLAGVDLQRFCGKDPDAETRQSLHELNVPDGHRIITFIGRITADKGVIELIESFRALQTQELPCSLLLIGPEEPDAPQLYQATNLADLPHVHLLGYQSNPECWLAMTDVLCLPSFREGFGNVVIEAAAMGVPTVGTDIPGLRDAVVHNETGILVPVKNVPALTAALTKLLVDGDMRSAMSMRAYLRAREQFDANKLNALLIEEYSSLHKGCLS
jgi:glycosyltransferase involved in cell wall biosynthesis